MHLRGTFANGPIGGKRRSRKRRRFDRLSVVDEHFDGQAPGHFGHAAEMVTVEVRNEQIVQLADTRVAGGSHDAIRIAVGKPGVAGVDEHRLPGRRHDQRRLAAFDVDEVDVERSRRLRRRRRPRPAINIVTSSRHRRRASDRIERHDTEDCRFRLRATVAGAVNYRAC